MTQDEREKLIDYIVGVAAYLEDVPASEIARDRWAVLSDDELKEDADWYEWLLSK